MIRDKNRRNKLIALAVLSALICFFVISSGYTIYVHLTREPKTSELKEIEKAEEETEKEKEKEEDILSIEEKFDQENERFIDPETAPKDQSDLVEPGPEQESADIENGQDFNVEQEPAALDLTSWIEGKGSSINYETKSFSSYQKAFEYANSTNGHFIIEGTLENNQVIYKIRFLENEKGGK